MTTPVPLGPFDLHELVGKGGMGEVWRGVHRDQGVPVAVKVITADAARQERYLEAFRNEVNAVARLDHPGIVWVFDYGTVGEDSEDASRGALVSGSPYLTMEYASGGTLHALLPELDWLAVKRILLELLDALAHAHARGVVHRDLKPGNVLLSRIGDVRPGLKLTDFGIARAMDFKPEETGSKPLGTLHYMAPEQVKSEWRQQGPWTDLYSVGCMAYRFTSGNLPFKGMRTAALMHAQITKMPPPPIPRFPVPDELTEWIWTLISKDPRDRFQRAADAAHALMNMRNPEGLDREEVNSLAAQFNSGARPPTDTQSFPGDYEPTALVPEVDPPGLDPDPDAEELMDTGELRRMTTTQRPKQPRTWRRPIPSRASPFLHGAGLGLWGIRTVPLVGRDSERDLLWNALREGQRRRTPRVVVVRGPTGTGKTRLVSWIGERAEEVGAALLIASQCVKDGASGHGLQQLTRSLLRIDHLDPEDQFERVQTLMTERGEDDPDLHTALCASASPDGAFDGVQVEGPARYAAIAAALQAWARDRPVFLTFDNAHYDPDVLEFVNWMNTRPMENPLPGLLTLVVRDEDLAESPEVTEQLARIVDASATVSIRLEGLKRSHRSVLVRELLGLEPVLAAQVERRTGGNPLFTIQLVGEWIASNHLVIGANGFELRDPEQATLPRSLDEVWIERRNRVVAGLPANAMSMLERAAVLGDEVDLIEWSQVCDDPESLRARAGQVYFRPEDARTRHELTARLLQSSLVTETDDGFRFTHGMFREAILAGAKGAGRLQQAHGAAAAMLESRRDSPADLERRSIHLMNSGHPGRAVPLLIEAVQLRSRISLPAALELIARAEKAMRDAGIQPSAIPWGVVRLSRCQLFVRLGRYTFAKDHVEALIRDAVLHGWEVTLTSARLLRIELGLLLEDPEIIRAAVALSKDLDEDTTVQQRIALSTFMCRLHSMRGDLTRAFEAASEVVRLSQDLDEIANAGAWALMGELCRQRGDLDEALGLQAHCVRVYREHRMALKLAGALRAIAETFSVRGELKRALKMMRESIRVYRVTGSAEVVQALVGYGELLLLTESWSDALVVWSLARRHLGEQQSPTLRVHLAAGLVTAAAGTRDWTGCSRHLAMGERASEQLTTYRNRATAPQLEEAASILERRKRIELATRALRLSRRLYRGSSQTEDVARIDAWVERLADA